MSDERLAALEQRLQVLEDERAIQHLLTSYGLAVDSGDVAATMAFFSEDTKIDLDKTVFMDGREQTREIVEKHAGPHLPNCAHVMGPFVVEVDGDRAVATGYATIFVREGDNSKVWRQAFGRWELERREGRWQITKRTSRSLGRKDAAALIAQALIAQALKHHV